MQTKVKICGIRSLEAAVTAIDAGADFLGFNFIRSSHRYISPDKAKLIIEKVRQKGNNSTKFVGVFKNEILSTVKTITDYLDLDYVQLHGEEDPKYCDELEKKIIKSFGVRQNFDTMTTFLHMKKYNTFYYMLEREEYGDGPLPDVHKVNFLTEKVPLFLAGGLNASNVFEVISVAKPYAVDVCSGIETNGQEDLVKIKEFLYEVK